MMFLHITIWLKYLVEGRGLRATFAFRVISFVVVGATFIQTRASSSYFPGIIRSSKVFSDDNVSVALLMLLHNLDLLIVVKIVL